MDEVALGAACSDEQAMSLAIHEAQKGAGFVSPNPQVGCVVLDSKGRLLAKGYHQKFGGPHAEIVALAGLASGTLRGARIFVTLEPCAHEGKTPSCAKSLAQLPLGEVIYGLVDPNPLVAGKGAEILRAADIPTTLYQGPLHMDLEEVCEHFLVNMREQRPFISLKVASSLDGQMALENGESKWITGDEARRQAHYLRATHDAILIGQGTLETDNPSLDIRHPDFMGKKNKVIVVLGARHSHIRVHDLNLWKTHQPEDIFFMERCGDNYQLLEVSASGNLLRSPSPTEYDLNFTHRLEKSRLAPSILVEGGAQVLSSFIAEKRAHRLYLFQAPILLGAKGGKPWTKNVIIGSLKEGIHLKNLKVRQFGIDHLVTGRF